MLNNNLTPLCSAILLGISSFYLIFTSCKCYSEYATRDELIVYKQEIERLIDLKMSELRKEFRINNSKFEAALNPTINKIGKLKNKLDSTYNKIMDVDQEITEKIREELDSIKHKILGENRNGNG